MCVGERVPIGRAIQNVSGPKTPPETCHFRVVSPDLDLPPGILTTLGRGRVFMRVLL